jgi:hypothetical protein
VKCIVHRIPNDDRIADSARAAIVLSQGRLFFRRARKPYWPTCHFRSIDSKTLALHPDVGIRLDAAKVREPRYQPKLDTSLSESDPVNYEALTVIGSGAASDFGLAAGGGHQPH